jgi:hypothetical protein
MGALNSSSVLLQKGNVWVGDNAGNAVDIGALRKVKFTGKMVKQQIESDNRGTIVNHARINGMIEFDWLEPGAPSNIAALFKGLVTLASIAGSSTPVSGEVIGASGSWAYLQPMWFAQQDGTQVVPTSITATGSVDGLLTVNTNYFVVQDAGTKKWGIYIKSGGGVTTLNQNITVTYTSTPASAKTVTGGTTLTQTARYVKIVGPLETNSNVTRTIELFSCTATSDMLIPFVDVENGNDVGVMPVTLENDKSATWTVTDQINPN